MKKTAALLLILTLTVCGTAAFAEDSVTGQWYAGTDGLTVRLSLNGDGSYVLSVTGSEPVNGAWELRDGFVYMNGDRDAPLSFNGRTLANSNMGLLFTREPAEDYAPAEPLSDASQVYYEGAWHTAYTMQNGTALPAGNTGDDTLIYIEELKAVLKGGPFGYRIADLTFENGAMTYAAEDMTASLVLQEDGYLRLTTEKDGASETRILICTDLFDPDANE